MQYLSPQFPEDCGGDPEGLEFESLLTPQNTPPEPSQSTGITFDQLFDRRGAAPCLIRSDDIYPHWEFRVPDCLRGICPDDAYAAKSIVQLFFTPVKDPEIIAERQRIVGELSQLPDLSSLTATLVGALDAPSGLNTLFCIVDEHPEVEALYAFTRWKPSESESYRAAKECVEEGLNLIPSGAKSIESALGILESAPESKALTSLVRELRELIAAIEKYPKEKILEPAEYKRDGNGIFAGSTLIKGIDCEEARSIATSIQRSLERLLFLTTAARLVAEGKLGKVTFDPTVPEAYSAGWNIFYPETSTHPNNSPSAVPVVAFSGSNKSGKSVSGVHQNFFIQVLAQSCGFTTVQSGNLQVYDSFALIDRARSDFGEGRSALTAEGHTHTEAYKTYGEKPFVGVDEPLSTTSPGEQASILFGLGHYIIKKNGKLLLATHSQDFTARAESMPGYKVYHFSSTVEPDGKITYTYNLTEGARGSDGVASAVSTNLLPDVVDRAKAIAAGQLEWHPPAPRANTEPVPTTQPQQSDKFTPIFNRNANPRRDWFDPLADRSHFLQVFSFDSSMRRAGGAWGEMAEDLFRESSMWEHLAKGSTTFSQLDRMILERSKVTPQERSARQELWRELVAAPELERLHDHTVSIARMGEHAEQVHTHVLGLREFNRFVHPTFKEDKNSPLPEKLSTVIRYVELQKALLADKFEHQNILDGLAAAREAGIAAENWLLDRTPAEVVALVTSLNEKILDEATLTVLRKIADTMGHGDLFKDPCSAGRARNYVRALERGAQISPEILDNPSQSSLLDSFGSRPALKRLEQYRAVHRELTIDESVLCSRVEHVPHIPSVTPELQTTLDALKIEGFEQNSIATLLQRCQLSPDAGREERETLGTLDRFCNHLRGLLLNNTPASKFLDPRHFQDLGIGSAEANPTCAALLDRAADWVKKLSDDDAGHIFAPLDAYRTDFSPVTDRILPFLAERSASQGNHWFASALYIDWPLRQLVQDSQDFWELSQWLSQARAPHLQALGAVLDGALTRFGIPLGPSVAEVTLGELGDPAAIAIKDPLAYWSRYSSTAALFLTSDEVTQAHSLAAQEDSTGLAPILQRMKLHSTQQIVRACGQLFEDHYAPTWKRLEELNSQLKKLVSDRFGEAPKPKSGLAALFGPRPMSAEAVLELSALSEAIAVHPEERYRINSFLDQAGIDSAAWRKIWDEGADKSTQKTQALEYARTSVLNHPFLAKIRAVAEEIKPIIEESEAIRVKLEGSRANEPDDRLSRYLDDAENDDGEDLEETPAPEQPEPSVTWPSDVFSSVNQAFQREARGLFLLGEQPRRELNAIIDEVASILSVGLGIKSGNLCIVESSTRGELIVEEAHSLLSSMNREPEISQSLVFSDEERGEGINGPNKSGKTHRLRIVARALSCAAQLGVAPAKRIVLPELDGVIFVDRITTKTEATLGSAGNELKIWSSIWPMIGSDKNYLVLVDEAFSTMTAADQALFAPALALEIMERGHYLSLSSHNAAALQTIISSGAPFLPKFLNYRHDEKGQLVFTRELKVGFAPSEARTILRQEGYPEELLEGCI
ncbi:MAG: hypothetical protein J0M12_12410 [Deltaproteobacteria bacterium]|nr:hypothetical protein [Deltaproteobacteria bacterium]